MKVALVGDCFSVERGTGLARYSRELLRGLRSMGTSAEPVCVRVPSVPFGTTISHVFSLPLHVLRRAQGFEVIHATSPITGLSFPLLKKPKVVTYHDLTSILCRDSGAALHTRLSALHVYRLVGKHCDRAIAVSTQTKQEMMTHLEIPEEKIAVVHNGIDERFVPIEKERKPHYTVGYLGALKRRKSVDYLIRAFYQLRKRHPEIDVRLSIWGEGEERPLLAELVEHLGLLRCVRFEGSAPDEEIVKVYNSFDVLVVPSVWEGFCIPILEAQRCGVPVIIREGAHIPLEVSKCCIRSSSEEDMAERMYDVITDADLRHRVVREGISHSRQFTWERAARETLQVYEEAYNGS
ncbi:glycosyltransferase family 4 protein [Methermicoccus shengliensis]|uniref:glycosyltransferase family 4 protein n=1 Tax=Methermicoccus shengliensis TaxID=660064 RepID=UPI0012F66025|nr:glycosyltransferase family 1 protein [Methermicoccus shengliensis]